MNVIGCAADDKRRATHFANDASEIGKEVITDFRCY